MYLVSIMSASSAALLVWMLTQRSLVSELSEGSMSLLEQARRGQLENASWIYSLCGRTVRQLANACQVLPQRMLDAIDLTLARAERKAPWTAGEWVAATLLQATCIALATAFAWWRYSSNLGQALLLLPAVLCGTLYLVWRRTRRQARRRLGSIRARLPFVIDSIALSIDAGASMQESMPMAANSCRDTALGEELAYVVADTERGRALSDAMLALKARLREPMVSEFVMAANTSHQMGSAVSELLLAMAQRMRQRRSHEIESAVGRAQVQLYYPGILLLVVCTVAVVAPFVAPMWNFLSPESP